MAATPPEPADLAEAMAELAVDDGTEDAKWEAPDGWWTRWSGDDIPLTIDEKVAMALGVAKGGEASAAARNRQIYSAQSAGAACQPIESPGEQRPAAAASALAAPALLTRASTPAP